jgi:hypothetical protein
MDIYEKEPETESAQIPVMIRVLAKTTLCRSELPRPSHKRSSLLKNPLRCASGLHPVSKTAITGTKPDQKQRKRAI